MVSNNFFLKIGAFWYVICLCSCSEQNSHHFFYWWQYTTKFISGLFLIPVREVKFFIVISLEPTQQPFKDLYCGGIAHYTTTKDTKNSSSHKLIFAWVFEEMEEELLSGVCFVGGRFHFLPSKRCLWFLSCNIQNFVCLLLTQEAYSHYTTKDTKESSSRKLMFMWLFEDME